MSKLNKTIDLRKIYNNKLVQIIINILFSLSTASLTALLLIGESSILALNIALPTLSFIIMLFISSKFKFLTKTFENINRIIFFISFFLGIYAIVLTTTYIDEYSEINLNIIFMVLSIPSAITFLYCFYTKLWHYFKLFIKSLDKLERNFLIISTSIFCVAIIVIYNITSVFTDAHVPVEDRIYSLTYSEENEETQKQGKSFVDKVYGILNR